MISLIILVTVLEVAKNKAGGLDQGMKRQIVLASSSPRRQELIQMLGIDAMIIASQADETVELGLTPQQVVEELAMRKASSVVAGMKDVGESIVIGSDTIVVLGDDILGKPQDADEATQMLRRLRGRQHRVYTGLACVRADVGAGAEIASRDDHITASYATTLRERVAITEPYGDIGQLRVFMNSSDGQPEITVGYTVSEVTFGQMSLEEIAAYVKTGEPLDKAGAYGIQGLGAVFVEKIKGDFYSVMGLPVNLLYRMLQLFDIRTF